MALASASNTGKKQVRVLRDMIATVIDRNLELKRQAEETQQKESDLPFDFLAASLTRALRETEEAMALESGGSRLYVVSELQATIKGFIDKREDGLVLRLARSEQKIRPEQLSSITMTLSRVPVAPAPEKSDLGKALEAVQTAFGVWDRDEGQNAAQDIADHASRLIAAPEMWGDTSLAREVSVTARAAGQFARDLRGAIPATRLRPLQAAVKTVSGVAAPVISAGRLTSSDVAAMAAALRALAAACTALTSTNV